MQINLQAIIINTLYESFQGWPAFLLNWSKDQMQNLCHQQVLESIGLFKF
jgi:hypothetical protein